jgi:hypothetical protein
MEQPGLPVLDGRPYLFLELERLPVASGKPAFCEVVVGSHSGRMRSERLLSMTTSGWQRFNQMPGSAHLPLRHPRTFHIRK